MTWLVILGLGAFVFLVLAFVLKLPRSGWELVGAALLVGLAGYALQGKPGLAGSPSEPRETRETGEAALIEARKELGEEGIGGSNWLITADALARRGQYAAAAGLLRGAAQQSPNDPDLWLAMGNALIGHANGTISPAAIFAFQRAADIDPGHPGPPFFMGLALAQNGRFAEARQLWAELLARPGDPQAPWRADLAARLERLDALLAMQAGEVPPASEPQATPGP